MRALRAWAVPVPIATAARVFDSSGRITDEWIAHQLATLGTEVVRVAERFAADHSYTAKANVTTQPSGLLPPKNRSRVATADRSDRSSLLFGG